MFFYKSDNQHGMADPINQLTDMCVVSKKIIRLNSREQLGPRETDRYQTCCYGGRKLAKKRTKQV